MNARRRCDRMQSGWGGVRPFRAFPSPSSLPRVATWLTRDFGIFGADAAVAFEPCVDPPGMPLRLSSRALRPRAAMATTARRISSPSSLRGRAAQLATMTRDRVHAEAPSARATVLAAGCTDVFTHVDLLRCAACNAACASVKVTIRQFQEKRPTLMPRSIR